MKIPSVKQSVEVISSKIRNFRYDRRQAKINSLVNIEKVHQNEAYNALSEAKEVIANYAKDKGVKVTFQSFPEDKTAAQMANQMLLTVSKGDVHQLRIIPADVSKTYARETEKFAILEKKDGGSYLTKGKFLVEDNFLRNVYRSIEELTKLPF